jgi:hypothetical protein
MAPTEENGIALVLAQLLKQIKGARTNGTKLTGMAFGGTVGEGGVKPGVNYTPPVGSPVYSAGPSSASGIGVGAGAAGVGGVFGGGGGGASAGGGSTLFATAPQNTNAFLGQGNTFASTLSNHALGMGQLELGHANLGLGQDRLGLDKQIAGQNYSLGQGQLSLGQSRLGLDKTIAAQQYELGLQQLEQAMEQVRMQIAAEKFIANQQYQLGLQGLSLQERERLDAWNLGTRQLDITSADDEFARIMRGVSEASVAGAGGTPSTGLYS